MKQKIIFLAATLLPMAAIAGQGTAGRGGTGAAQAKIDTTVTIRAEGPTLEFAPDEIMLKQGLRVRVRFINGGSFPHNLVFVRNEDDIPDLAKEAVASDKTGNVPLSDPKKLIAHTTLAQPNQTVEVTFIVPPPGVYPFVCFSPGHTNTMVGTLRSIK